MTDLVCPYCQGENVYEARSYGVRLTDMTDTTGMNCRDCDSYSILAACQREAALKMCYIATIRAETAEKERDHFAERSKMVEAENKRLCSLVFSAYREGFLTGAGGAFSVNAEWAESKSHAQLSAERDL